MTVQRFNAIAASEIATSPTGKYVLASDYDSLLLQNIRMREAIEFAIAPDLWSLICADEGAWRYKRGKEKYWDMLKRALEPQSGSAGKDGE